MNLLAHMTVLVPSVLLFSAAYTRFEDEPPRAQLKSGGLLLAIMMLPLAGLLYSLPGGSLSELPEPLQPKVEFIFYLAMAPLAGGFMLALLLIGRGLRKSRTAARPEGGDRDR